MADDKIVEAQGVAFNADVVKPDSLEGTRGSGVAASFDLDPDDQTLALTLFTDTGEALTALLRAQQIVLLLRIIADFGTLVGGSELIVATEGTSAH